MYPGVDLGTWERAICCKPARSISKMFSISYSSCPGKRQRRKPHQTALFYGGPMPTRSDESSKWVLFHDQFQHTCMSWHVLPGPPKSTPGIRRQQKRVIISSLLHPCHATLPLWILLGVGTWLW
jgi:hypothetical protein